MSNYYFEALKKQLDGPLLSETEYEALLEKTGFFFQILKVKLESGQPELQNEAAKELRELRKLVESRIPA